MAGRGNVQVKIQTEYDGSGVSRAEQGFSKFGSSAQKHAHETISANSLLTGSFKKVIGAAAGLGLVYKGVQAAKGAVETTESLAKATELLHRNFGLTLKDASTWASVAKTNNVDTASLQLSFTALSRAIEAAHGGSKKQIQTFKDLGISQQDLKDQNFQQTLQDVVKGLTDMEGGSKRAADAQTLLGRGAKTLAPLFRGDGLGFQQQAKWAEKYGATLDGHAIKSSKQLAVASEQLKFAQMGLQIQFTEKIVPALLSVEKAAGKVLAIFNDPKLTPDEKAKKIEKIFDDLGDKAEKVFERVAPILLNEAAQLAPKAAGAFVHAWLNAGIWGKLFGVALLSKKLGVFSTVGTLAANKWGGSFKQTAEKRAAEASAAAAGEQGLASSSSLGKWKAAGLLLGETLGAAAAAAIISNIQSSLQHGDPRKGGGGSIFSTFLPAAGGTDITKLPGAIKNLVTGGGGGSSKPGTTAPTHHPHGKPHAHGGSVAKGASLGTSTHVKARAAGATYSHAQLKGLAMSVGLNAQQAEIAAAVAQAESSGRSDATNHNTNGSIDVGLWQINSVHGYSTASMMVPQNNARAMAAVSSGGTNWQPWVTFQNGAYRRYLTGGAASPAKGGGAGVPSGLAQALKGVTNFPIAPTFSTGLRNQIRGNQNVVSRGTGALGDIDRLVSQQERKGNYGAATWLLKAKEQDQKVMLKSAKAALRGYKKELKILRHQLRTTPKGRQSKIVSMIQTIQGRISDLKGTVHDLGFDIQDTELDIQDELSQGADAAAGDSSGSDAAAQAASDAAAAQQALADQLAALVAAVSENNRIISGTSGVTQNELRRSLVGLLNGDLGGFAYPRTLSAGSGSRARY